VGIWEEGLGNRINLWNLLGVPEICLWKPDYVITFLGWGDRLRIFRVPYLPATTPEDYRTSMENLTRGILKGGAIPVHSMDGTHPTLLEYQEIMFQVCDSFGIRCGPDMTELLSGRGFFVGTDLIHPNVLGHEAIAEAFAEWFAEEPRAHRSRASRHHSPRFCRQY
jgi:hypothetical protein